MVSHSRLAGEVQKEVNAQVNRYNAHRPFPRERTARQLRPASTLVFLAGSTMRFSFTPLAAGGLIIAAVLATTLGGQAPAQPDEARVPWQTSKIHGSPEP